MAFDDGLGLDPSTQDTQNYSVSATGLISRTLTLWSRKLIQYIIIIGIFGAACAGVSYLMLVALFNSIGVIGADPISHFFSFFTYTTFPDIPFIVAILLFSVVAFVINALVIAATIKFALADYGGFVADVGMSFSHAIGKIKNIIIIQSLLSLLISVATFPGLVMFSRAMEVIDISDPFNLILSPESIEMLMTAFGFLLVGGIFVLYFMIRFAPTLAIVTDTELSAIDSLKQSWELTSGNFMHVFAGQILIGILVIVIGAVVSSVMDAVFMLDPVSIVPEAIVIALLFGSLNYIYAAVLYRDLSSRRGAAPSSTLDDLMI
ncbi:MAG: hypothetical protein KGD60_00475 [Candidatus Thorarchaeota archaeon]|nr:hypothetical protein [Candidatus Thorarchaeota archaeon]